VVIPPIAVGTKDAQAAEYPALNIRLFEEEPVVPEQLVGWGALNEEMLEFLAGVVGNRKSVVIAGGTGTGKTTMLGALLTFIPPEDRVVTIEDTAELRLTASHWVSLESRPPSVEGKYEISMADLINASLRMTPTWVIVGEIRTGMACAQLLQTQISGHSGMSTIHADTPRKAVQTLVLRGLQSGQLPKVAAIKTLIALAVDCFVQIQYDRRGMRRVTHISEVDEELQGGEVQLRDIFRFTEDSGEPTWERVEEPQRLAR
jgi:pilus assembly protein CpaF